VKYGFFILLLLFTPNVESTSQSEMALYSRISGSFKEAKTWSASSHEGSSSKDDLGCSISNSQTLYIQDSIVSTCDRILANGSARVVIKDGGKLHLKGSIELSGGAQMEVQEGGELIVDRNLIVSGDGKFQLAGNLTVKGDIEVNGHGFVCGTGFTHAGGSISGIGWCLDLHVLPIEIIGIEARLVGNEQIVLNWTSSIASETDAFIVERSTNGMTFKEVARVDGSTANNEDDGYTIEDKGLAPGHYYYRITQVDRTGGKEAEELVAATITRDVESGICELEVDPNPCEPSCTVTLTDCPGSVFKTYIMDGAGRMISELVPINTHPSDNKIQYYLNKNNFITPGIYVIRAQSEDADVAKKLIIK
jgi:hypothetical protein